jgi:hypothetical protein
VGFFLSLSLREDGVLPVVKPFAPFPDMFEQFTKTLDLLFFQRGREERERDLAFEFRFYVFPPHTPFIFSKSI